ncbi:class I SAM-dependent methyltransferase [Vibrio astriarenae]|uniref:class I SAM-dependent methyltransferase n=1 Tax=Vibrio astriarenae TaxID=1481923 RepID=UPI003736DD51
MTNQYYSENALDFFSSTVNVDVRKLYEQFLPHVPNQGKILDAGCGSGRDSKSFLDLGYQVTSLDANESLAKLAEEYLGQKVVVATFDSFEAAPGEFDAIWACASLLHVPAIKLPETFNNLSLLLKSGGVFYCSFKYGDNEQVRNGRLFSDLNEAKLENILISSSLSVVHTWVTSDARPGRESEKWLNAILTKK